MKSIVWYQHHVIAVISECLFPIRLDEKINPNAIKEHLFANSLIWSISQTREEERGKHWTELSNKRKAQRLSSHREDGFFIPTFFSASLCAPDPNLFK